MVDDVIKRIDRANRLADSMARLGRHGLADIIRKKAVSSSTSDLAAAEEPGLFFKTLEALNVPAQMARGAIVGKDRATARELLAHFDIEPETHFNIRDPSTYAAGAGVLLADIVTDPLTFLGGIGALTKLGKSKKLLDLARVESRAKRVPKEILKAIGTEDAKRLGYMTRGSEEAAEMARSLRMLRKKARGSGPRRALLQYEVPFTSLSGRFPLMPRRAEEALMRGFGRAAQHIPGRKLAAELFSQTSRLGRAAPFAAVARQGTRRIEESSAALGKQLGEEQIELIKARSSGNKQSFQEAQDSFFNDVREARETRHTLAKESSSGEWKPGEEPHRVYRNKLSLAEGEYADKLDRLVDDAYARQLRAGVRNADAIPDYAERILTAKSRRKLSKSPGGLAAFRETVANSARELDIRNLSVREGSQIKRKDYLRDMLTTDVNRYFREKKLGKVEFNLNPAETVARTVKDRDISVLHAGLAHGLIDEFAGIPGQAGTMSIAKFLADTKLKTYTTRSGKRLEIGNKTADEIEKILAKNGISGRLPAEVSRAFTDVVSPIFQFKNYPELNKFVGTYDALSSAMRLSVTTIFPAFHVRNFTSTLIQNFLGGVSNPKFYFQALREIAKTRPGLARSTGVAFSKKARDRYLGIGVMTGGKSRVFREEATEAGARAGRTGEIVSGAIEKWRDTPGLNAGFLVGEMVEDIGRMAHFLAKKADGLTDAQAVHSVNKFLFDYSNAALTPFERDIANRLFFFYRFTRFAVPLLLRQALESPNRVAMGLKAVGQPELERDIGLPRYAKEQAAIPIGTTAGGDIEVIAGLGTPFEELGKFDVFDPEQPNLGGSILKLAQEFGSLLNPMIKALPELSMDRSFYRQEPISELDKSPLHAEIPGISRRIIRGKGPHAREEFRTDPLVNYLLRSPPFGRILSTVDSFVDPERDKTSALLRTLTGLRTQSYDPEVETAKAAKRVLRGAMSGIQDTAEIKIPYGETEESKKQLRPTKRIDRQISDRLRAMREIRG